jgi:hypothetical protein
MECTCETSAHHAICASAYLCGPLDRLSPPLSRPSTPPPEPRNTTGILTGDTSSLTRRALQKRYRRKKLEQKRVAALNAARRLGPPSFVKSSSWHLAQGEKALSGYKGLSNSLCKTIPNIPKDADAKTQLEILKEHGYEVVPAPM